MVVRTKPEKRSARWWKEDEADCATAIFTVAREIRDQQRWRRDADEYHAELYAGGPEAADIKGNSTNGMAYEPGRYPYNICRSAVDTLASKIAKSRPLPQVLTQNGDWVTRKKSRKLSQFIEGEFYRQKVFEKNAKQIVRDALIFGRGLLYITTEGKEICTERAAPWEIFVDRWDARSGCPRNLYRIRSIDRGVAIALYGEDEDGEPIPSKEDPSVSLADLIEDCDAGPLDGDESGNEDSTVDRVWIVEAWHLPSRKGGTDGRYVMAIEGTALIDRKWERDYFPFAMLNYADPVAGFWGTGLVEQAEGFQYNINELSERVDEAHRMLGMTTIVTDSDVPDAHFVNGYGYVLRKKVGSTIDTFQPNPIAPQTYNRLRDLTPDCFNYLGISQMSAQSTKPAGITAAVALQTLDDVETDRFALFGRAYETWCVAVAGMLIDACSEIASEYGEYSVSVPMKGGLLPLNWSDVKVDGFELRAFPTSLLPTEPAARLDKLMQLFSSGLVDRATFLRELESPDLAAEMDLETADKLCVDEMLESMLYADDPTHPGAYLMPTEFLDLDWAIKRAQQKINRATIDGADDDNIELLARFISDAKATQKVIGALEAQDGNPQPANDAAQPGGGIAPLAAPKAIHPPNPMQGLPTQLAA